MANQGAQLILQGRQGRKSLSITVVDTDGSAATFDDLGSATVWTADQDYRIVDLIGEGTTAPAAVNTLQPNVNQTDVPARFDLAAAYSATAEMARRVGALAGAVIKQGSTFRLISRA